jgi:acyl carrier protein
MPVYYAAYNEAQCRDRPMKQRIVRILADSLGLPESEIPADASMEKMSEWDSIAHLNVVMTLEEEFQVEFTAEEFVGLNSLPAMERALAGRGIA